MLYSLRLVAHKKAPKDQPDLAVRGIIHAARALTCRMVSGWAYTLMA